jgi:glycosyltransferase involved in cell wall biosynthesis
MARDFRISLVVLTYNEIEGVTVLAPRLADPRALDVDEVVAVDGGSTDGTLDVFAANGIRVLKQISRGRGEAMKLAAQELDSDYLVFFSPDGNEAVEDIRRFRPYFVDGYDLVIASRMMKGARNEEDAELLRFRKWANNGFNLAANLLCRREGPYITDSINGFRGIRRTLLSELEVDAIGFTIEYQMTMRAMRKRVRIVEFPTHEGARIGGETKAPSIPTGIQFVKCLAREASRGAR